MRELDTRGLNVIHAIAEGKNMEHKTMEAQATVATDRGEFAAIAAAWTLDRANEQIRRGAFARTIERWKASAKDVPVHWNHQSGADAVIGSVFPNLMHETSEGLRIEGRLDLRDSEVARQAWRSMKANRVAISFGYLTTQSHKRADGVVELTEIDLFEVSIVPAPCNSDTRFLNLKSASAPESPPMTESQRRDLDRELAKWAAWDAAPATKSAKQPLRTASFDA